MPWHLGLFLRTDHQPAVLEMIFRLFSFFLLLHTRSFWHLKFITCATSTVFLSFSTCGFISIILDCWCFIYELICNKFTLLVQIIIYWKKCSERFLKDGIFFPFCEICKEFVLQCTEMNKHWKLICCLLLIYCRLLLFSSKETRIAQFGGQ